MGVLLEVACFNPESAGIAARAGAHRIELCEDYSSGGVTPILTDFIQLKKQITVPVFVMIRPRPGNFVYSNDEFQEIKSQISNFLAAGADGLVFGMLNEDNTLDVPRNSELIALAGNLPCTLHRAFDETPDLFLTLQQAKQCGFKRILTSGGKGKAEENIATLKNLVRLSDNQLIILPGGGVRSAHAKTILWQTDCEEIHTAAVSPGSENADENEIKAILRQLNH